MDENKILKCQKYYIFKIRDIVNNSKRQIMRLVELTFLCQTLKNTKKLIVF